MNMNDKDASKINNLGFTYQHPACFESFIQCENDQETTQRTHSDRCLVISDLCHVMWTIAFDLNTSEVSFFSKYLSFFLWHAFPIHFIFYN